jgi:hypothetical protein
MRFVKIESIIEEKMNEDVYNMEVEYTNCFAINGGYIVHNSRYATEEIWSKRKVKAGNVSAGKLGF